MILKVTLLIKILARSIGMVLQIYKIGGAFVQLTMDNIQLAGNGYDALF